MAINVLDEARMEDWLVAILSLSSGFAGAVLFFAIREGVLYPSRTKEQRRQAIVKRKLEKLYTPLYMLIKYSKFILRDKKPTLTYIGDSGKKDLDSLILNYGYLAEDELMELLPRILGPGFYQASNAEIVPKVVDLIVTGFEKLRNDYLSACE